MEYKIRLVFHLPEYYFHDGRLSACDSQNFRAELLDSLGRAGADYFFSIPAKTFIKGREFDCEHLVVYATDDTYYSYINIFHETVCKHHSELKQKAYYYESYDALVSLVIGGDSSDII